MEIWQAVVLVLVVGTILQMMFLRFGIVQNLPQTSTFIIVGIGLAVGWFIPITGYTAGIAPFSALVGGLIVVLGSVIGGEIYDLL